MKRSNITFFRTKREKNYTTLNTHCLRNKKISLKAKGLHSFLGQLPDTWELTIAGLEEYFTDGKTSINNAIRELRDARYLKMYQLRKGGRFCGTYYQFFEEPYNPTMADLNDKQFESFLRMNEITIHDEKESEYKIDDSYLELEVVRKHLRINDDIKKKKFDLPEIEYIISRTFLMALHYFCQYPGLTQTNRHFCVKSSNLVAELEKWIRHNKENDFLMVNPSNFISSSFTLWMERSNQFNNGRKSKRQPRQSSESTDGRSISDGW